MTLLMRNRVMESHITSKIQGGSYGTWNDLYFCS